MRFALMILLFLSGCAAHKPVKPVQPQPPPPGVRSIGVTPTRNAVGKEWFNDRVKDSGLQPRVKP